MTFASTDFFPHQRHLIDEFGLSVSGGSVARGGSVASLTPGPTGACGLSLTEHGRTRRLASVLDPAAEDAALLDKFPLDPSRGLLCLGLGLGYYVEEAAERLDPHVPLWVMESRPELAAAALMSRDFSRLLARPGFRLFIGPFGHTPPWGEATPPPQILARPGAMKHFASEYPSRTEAPAPRAIKRVIVFQCGYYLDREIAGTLEAMGIEVAVWRFQRGPASVGENFRELLKLIRNFRPQMLLTVNHLGFDAEGVLDDVVSRLNLPVASWFVDSPVFILGDRKPSDKISVFSWDGDYLESLAAKGFKKVHYLPLASDPRFFHPLKGVKPVRDLAFVGDAMRAATDKYLAKLGWDGRVLGKIDEAAAEFLQKPELVPTDLKPAAGPGQKLDLAALVTWRASRLWRLKVLSALPRERLTLAGDEEWPQLLAGAAQTLPAIDYYTELSAFYQSNRVNINITSAQMKSGLNQRVFDVPAAGAFLLTDSRAQLEALFEPGREVVVYSTPEEARELALWHLKHESAREKIAGAAHARVKSSHLYERRLAEMLKIMAAEA